MGKEWLFPAHAINDILVARPQYGCSVFVQMLMFLRGQQIHSGRS